MRASRRSKPSFLSTKLTALVSRLAISQPSSRITRKPINLGIKVNKRLKAFESEVRKAWPTVVTTGIVNILLSVFLYSGPQVSWSCERQTWLVRRHTRKKVTAFYGMALQNL